MLMKSSWYYICNTEQVKKMMVVSCSEPGSQRRAQEEQTYLFFCDLLEECESKYASLVDML